MRGHNICFRCGIRKIIYDLAQYPLLSGALASDSEWMYFHGKQLCCV